jgi:CDP-diacylglycerol--glycerol-3-phosphate 3-phosphatidyltransferase
MAGLYLRHSFNRWRTTESHMGRFCLRDTFFKAIVDPAMTLPDLLSLYRILMTSVVVIMILHFWPETGRWVAILTGTVWFSDMIDGTPARQLRLGSALGPLLDWLGDKIFVLCVFIALTVVGLVPAWVTIVFVVREVAVMQLRYYCLEKGVVVKSRILGKLKLGTSMLAIMTLAAGISWANVVLYLALVLAVISAVDYTALAIRSLRS